MKSKHLLLLLLLAIGLPWAANAQTVTIGTGTDSQYDSPMNNWYNYSFVEMIYTADEIAAGHPTENSILSVGFHLASEGLNNKTYTITVYMKNIDATSFESASHVAFASTDAVATKNVTATASGWVTVELDSPFTYDPTKSLLIGVNKTAGGYAGSSYKWSYTTTTEYRHLRNQQDNPAAYDPTTPPTYPTMDYKRPNVQLTFGVPPTCFAPQNLTCTEHTATSATLTWQRHANGTENAWVLQYSTDNTFATGVQSVNVSNTPSTQLTDLTAETNYYARVRPDCDENLWSDVCEFKPTNAIPQTVCDGTTTNSYVPVYGNYAENYNKDEFIIPATTEGMAGMAGGTISKMTFYLSSPASGSWGAALYRVFMKEVNESSFASTSYYGTDGATIVYEGALDGTQSTMTIEFTTDYEYNGGNLLVGIYEYNKGSYKSCSFYGITSNNGALYKNSSTSLESITSGTLQNFIPKTTFTYLPTNTPKPRNIQVSDITASQATVSWEAPATGTPTGYEYQIKVSSNEWPTSWTSAGNNLSVDPTGLTASTDYVVRVRAVYAEGESGSIETEFRTLDACAFPTNFTATTVPGVGTDANFSWVKGYDETAWNLQLATDVDFNNVVTTYFTDDGFVVDGNNVTFHATTLTPEQTYFARVQADCGGGSTSTWSNVAEFTPTNYVDFTVNENATSSTSYAPFYYYYVGDGYTSQFIIPAASLTQVAGGTVKRLTFYSTSSYANVNWGNAEFAVYVKEVENANFPTTPTSGQPLSFDDMTNVYSGSLSVIDNQMVIELDNSFEYNGGNLMIGFDVTTLGTENTVSWVAASANNAIAYSYYGYSYSTYSNTWTASRASYLPKVTFNYQPTPYKYPVIDEANCTFGTTTAHIAWAVTGATPTGYQYQYKPASATEWPSAWTSVTTAYADLSGLTPGSFYDFRVKALYDGGNESVVVDYSFVTECAAITAFPWSEKFETYSAGDFSHPCWVNEHISGNGTNIFKVYTSTNGSNTTHQLQLPDQTEGTLTKLRLPEMNLPSNDYQFVIDVYRNNSTYNDNYPYEGIRVFASTDGNIEGATELTFIPRQYNVSSALIPEESEVGWYTYEIPIGVSGTCYIILRGESQYCTSTYMDNLTVEQIPTCARPSELASSNVTNHSATIEWTAGDAEQTLWQIAYSKTNFDPNTANFDVTTVTTIDATAHPFTLDKILDAESTYCVYVRANCGTATEPDFGPWNRKGISFTTLAATPAPSNFVASNPASAKVDLVWNAGGGDFESWELYYVASETAPEAPTASTTATVSNITTLPTTEAPYVLEVLNPVTKYYAWIRAKHVWDNETTYSDWVALTSSYFETLDACPTPTDLVATNLTSVSADLSWVGSDDVDSYTVQYRTAAGMGAAILSEEFASTSVPTNWTKYYGLFNETEGTATLTTDSYGWYFGTDHSLFKSNHAYVNIYGNNQKWLVTPNITIGEGNVLYFDLALTAYSSSVTNPQTTGIDDKFFVLVSTDNKETWNVLRKWDNAGSSYVYNEIAVAGESITFDLSSFKGESVYIAFYGESTTSNADNNLHIDNVIVGTPTPAGNWIDATTNVEEQSFQLTGLTAGTKYDVHVKSNCTNGEYCEPVTFTTLADGTKVFTNAAADGKWGTAGNWAPTGTPVITDNAILRANATIESGCVAKANKITFENSTNLTIADGGQLQTDNSVYATVKKSITGYGAGNEEDKANYYLIGNPLSSSITVSKTDNTYNIRKGTYDLYSWSRTADLEWTYYGANNTSSLTMSNGTGYLYANAADVELTFTGTVKANNTAETKTPYYVAPSGETEFSDWNLFANPFVCDAYVTLTAGEGNANMAYYRMKADGTDFEPATGAIHPLEGFFVQATASGQSVSISRDQASKSRQLNVNLRSNNKQLDNAILVFGEGQNLGKFSFRQGSSKVYMPVEGNDYAALFTTEAMGALPVNFKAENNGVYTLSFTNEEVTFSYLHLIDNMTGIETDLLANPSYTFEARTTDYESRFKLVFATGNNANDDAFAFYSNGSFVINNEGNATLQVIDMNGRILKSESINGCANVNVKAAAGVYMLRLVNGNDVKVQKVVVR